MWEFERKIYVIEVKKSCLNVRGKTVILIPKRFICEHLVSVKYTLNPQEIKLMSNPES